MDLKTYITKYCVSISVLARKAKVNRQTIYRILKGDNCTPETKTKLEKVTNGLVSIEKIAASKKKISKKD